MTYNEVETRFWLIDLVLRDKGFDAIEKILRCEQAKEAARAMAFAAAAWQV